MRTSAASMHNSSKMLTSQKSPSILESAKPKGFPSGTKRLQPIKATDLRNSEVAASPLTSATAADSKLNNDAMRLTHPSSMDSAVLNVQDHQDTGYKSATEFGPKGAISRTAMAQNSSKGSLSLKKGPSIGQRGTSGSQRPLPSIDHSKQMDKLRSLTGRSEDFGATATS